MILRTRFAKLPRVALIGLLVSTNWFQQTERATVKNQTRREWSFHQCVFGSSLVAVSVLAVASGGHPLFGLTGKAEAQTIVQPSASKDPIRSKADAQQAILAEGWHTTPDEARKLEEQLAAQPDNLPFRIRLLSYYTQYMISKPRTTHLLWMIEHHPDADVFRLGSEITSALQDWTGLNPPVESERARTLWLQQAERFPSNTKVLANAALALGGTTAFELVKRARAAEPQEGQWVNWLGFVYARAVRVTLAGGPQNVRVFTLQSQNRDAWPAFSLPLAESELLKRELETSTDVALIRAAGNALVTETSLLLTGRTGDELVASETFGRWLLSRAQELDSQYPH